MHKRIIWTLFFGAFILDFFRSRSTPGKPKPYPRNNKEEINEKEIEKEEEIISSHPKEKMKARFNDEELKVTYDEENISKKVHKKKRNIYNNINLRIEFCQSWSHRGYFNQVKEHLEKTYSNISVIPSDYPLSTTRQILYYLVTFLQVSLFLTLFCGKYIRPYIIGFVPENILDWIEGNKMMVGIGGYFVGNILSNNITNSGAFEIYVNERLIWSAINNEKRVPNMETMISMIQRFGGKLIEY